jgi:hypothetical protein
MSKTNRWTHAIVLLTLVYLSPSWATESRPNKFESSYASIAYDFELPTLCYLISPKATLTAGFSPSGHQISYTRSKCFLNVAIKSSNKDLCKEVESISTLFLNGAKVSPEGCIEEIDRKSRSNLSTTPAADLILKFLGYSDADLRIPSKSDPVGYFSAYLKIRFSKNQQEVREFKEKLRRLPNFALGDEHAQKEIDLLFPQCSSDQNIEQICTLIRDGLSRNGGTSNAQKKSESAVAVPLPVGKKPLVDPYGSVALASFAGLMQACAEAYPTRKAEYQSRLQNMIADTFGAGPAAQEQYNTLMADEQVKKMNRDIIAEIKQNLAQFEEACNLRGKPLQGTPGSQQAQRAPLLSGYSTPISMHAGYIYSQDKAYGTAANLSGSCVDAAPGSLFSRAGHPASADPKVNPNRYSNVVGYIERFMRETGTTEIFCYSTPERYAVEARIPGKSLYDCFDSSGQSIEIATRITGPSCQPSEPKK